MHLLYFMEAGNITSVETLQASLPSRIKRSEWINAGGQLIQKSDIELMKKKVRENKIRSWDHLHTTYDDLANKYPNLKMMHAIAGLFEINELSPKKITKTQLESFLSSLSATKKWITEKIYESRAKDYVNPYRKLVYENEEEMNSVVGKLEDNSFINLQRQSLISFDARLAALKKKLKIK